MKKVLFIISILFSLASKSQDSVKVTITPQARDLEYIGSFIFIDEQYETIFDSVKVKFRLAQEAPTGTTTISVTAYTVDLIRLITRLKNDATAIKGGSATRVEALLRTLNQVYLTSKLDALDQADLATFISMRLFGRQKLKKSPN